MTKKTLTGWKFQSTLPVGGATGQNVWEPGTVDISIHAPRGGSDLLDAVAKGRFRISIHAPRGGSDGTLWDSWDSSNISIHAPRGGSDCRGEGGRSSTTQFQSTLPVGGATHYSTTPTTKSKISIHAPRGGSDRLRLRLLTTSNHFNPRSPWGERLFQPFQTDVVLNFNPRSPWGERRKPFFFR